MTCVQGFNPRTGKPAGPPIAETTADHVDAICTRAQQAFKAWSSMPGKLRAAALEKVADAIDANCDDLATLADSETALGVPRLTGETRRTSNQLRLFANVLREGSYLEATLDSPDAGSVPPRPDLRRMLQPLGPVAVFSSSNFPFAFSVAGGDTASALAAGCSVVVKAHEAHPATSRETARIVAEALAAAGAPDGTFGIVYGIDAGTALVRHHAIKAVGFTGSTRGGRALLDMANARPDPIPFYGELGSLNPCIVLPGAAAERGDTIAQGYAASLTLGCGQFCTNPGLLFVPGGLVARVAGEVRKTAGGAMLSARIRDAYVDGIRELAAASTRVATGGTSPEAWAVQPELFHVDLATFAAHMEQYTVEHFGPAGLVVSYDHPDEAIEVLAQLPGTLTGTVHAAEHERTLAHSAAAALRRIAGRVIYNAWPTGVAVAWGMQHGGPWPATTHPLHTSVGATAIRRWLMPVSFQGWPDDLLPAELQDANPLHIPRRRDGVLGMK